jgi:HlyD family secretion protein
MAISLNRIRSLKIWQVGLLVVVLLVAGGAAYTAYARSTSADAGSLKENQQLFKVAFGDLVDQVSTNGSLVFPEKEALSFGTEGIVSELLVEEGQRVPQGEVLAKLDPLTVSSLHREVAQVRLDLQAAEELLKETRQGHTPLELAQLQEAVADADFQVQEAQEALEDAQVPHTAEQIQAQEELLAAARVTLRDAKDSLAELSPDNRLRYAEAVQLKAAAKAELENAQLLAEAIQSRADWEVALEEAGTALRVYEDRNSLLNQYRSEKDEALESLEKAQRKLADLLEAEAETGGLQSHIRGQKELLKLVQESYDMAQEKVAAAEQLDADMTLAKASLNSAKDELERLEPGPDPLERQELAAAVQLARADLSVVEKSLSSQQLEVDPLESSLLQAQVALAQAAADQAEEDLTELLLGADSLEVVLRESQLTVAQAALAEAEEDLAELLAGPDPLEVALFAAEVATARQALEDAAGRLADSTLRAPFAGIVSLVNVEPGDQVGARAEILVLSNPAIVEVDGIVDEVDVLSLREGVRAEVTLDALPGRRLEGTLTEIAPAALSQQGVVSYPIRISLELPRRMEPREGLSAVANIVLREERNVLRVPQQALQGSFDEPMVKVKTPLGFEERSVTLGDTDGYWVAIREGLEEGDQVVVQTASANTSQFSYRQLRGQFRGSQSGGSGRSSGGSRWGGR